MVQPVLAAADALCNHLSHVFRGRLFTCAALPKEILLSETIARAIVLCSILISDRLFPFLGHLEIGSWDSARVFLLMGLKPRCLKHGTSGAELSYGELSCHHQQCTCACERPRRQQRHHRLGSVHIHGLLSNSFEEHNRSGVRHLHND